MPDDPEETPVTPTKPKSGNLAGHNTTVAPKKTQCKGSEQPVGSCCSPTKCKPGYKYLESQGPDGGGSCFKEDAVRQKDMDCGMNGAGVGASCKCTGKKLSCKMICY